MSGPKDGNDFSNVRTIGEAKADASGSGADWSLRDMLISLLREIDDGTLDLAATNTQAVICLGTIFDDGSTQCRLLRGGKGMNAFVTQGLLAECLHLAGKS